MDGPTIAKLVAQVAGEMSLQMSAADKSTRSQVERWRDQLQRTADALGEKLK